MTQSATGRPDTSRALRAGLSQICAKIREGTGAEYLTLGKKVVSGHETDERSVKFYITDKGMVGERRTIPSTVDVPIEKCGTVITLPSDVVEIYQQPELMAVRAGDKLRAFDGDVGICGITFIKNGFGYGMTNSHVVRRMESGGIIGLVDWFENGVGWRDAVATPIAATELSFDRQNNEDAAIIKFSNRDLVTHFKSTAGVQIKKADIIRPFSGSYWYHVDGVLNQCRAPEPIDTGAFVKVDGKLALYNNFVQLELSSGSIMPGMSGALLCRTNNNVTFACGLIFGGIERQFVWAFHFEPIFNRAWASLP